MTQMPLNPIDQCLVQFDRALRTCMPGANHAERPSPAVSKSCAGLNETERQHSAGLMRVNHTGEVCAQALYAGQASTARLGEVRATMEEASAEEIDHLAWCEQRLEELDSRPSLLNPLFYGVSFGVGALAGLVGDRWSLGFVAETERQVCEHLENHLQRLPEGDTRSKAVLEQMLIDEKKHGDAAKEAGGRNLPAPIRHSMLLLAEVMKKSTYRL
ncbi:MAG: 2-polyprenyl-3-methyl-6-methoxy-1,4-benzoquinone monooxygenase [Gammaproteobacteria bacterium]|nr:2-polyprenyl-3-methyl-6-methoxy-1,4-benzoquinone monooxygenase [Gammaproteobacteria bacterium]MCY4357132.1 2-polyprenyl-3-methyl-6-methoxy-1,4-benzoquinone monooxygenase [Gammaproteobacteria bacterium]